jgi:hypothetical protein
MRLLLAAGRPLLNREIEVKKMFILDYRHLMSKMSLTSIS